MLYVTKNICMSTDSLLAVLCYLEKIISLLTLYVSLPKYKPAEQALWVLILMGFVVEINKSIYINDFK